MPRPRSWLSQALRRPAHTAQRNATAIGFNGNYYDAILAPGITWTAANTAATSLTYSGAFGHLATITSLAEDAFLNTLRKTITTKELWVGGFQQPELARTIRRWRSTAPSYLRHGCGPATANWLGGSPMEFSKTSSPSGWATTSAGRRALSADMPAGYTRRVSNARAGNGGDLQLQPSWAGRDGAGERQRDRCAKFRMRLIYDGRRAPFSDLPYHEPRVSPCRLHRRRSSGGERPMISRCMAIVLTLMAFPSLAQEPVERYRAEIMEKVVDPCYTVSARLNPAPGVEPEQMVVLLKAFG